jgi:hypothetical protein
VFEPSERVEAARDRIRADETDWEFFPPIKGGPDPDFAPLHFATHLYATAEFVEAETARGSNQPNCRLVAIR